MALNTNGRAYLRVKSVRTYVATWTPHGRVTWASRSDGPTCVQKGHPEILPTTERRGRPIIGHGWMPNNGRPYTPTKWQPNNGHP